MTFVGVLVLEVASFAVVVFSVKVAFGLIVLVVTFVGEIVVDIVSFVVVVA